MVKKEENKYLSIVINKREKHLTNMGKLNNCLKKLMKKRKKKTKLMHGVVRVVLEHSLMTNNPIVFTRVVL